MEEVNEEVNKVSNEASPKPYGGIFWILIIV
jgi:hypothetical protein